VLCAFTSVQSFLDAGMATGPQQTAPPQAAPGWGFLNQTVVMLPIVNVPLGSARASVPSGGVHFEAPSHMTMFRTVPGCAVLADPSLLMMVLLIVAITA
jgi:hypothetical protein